MGEDSNDNGWGSFSTPSYGAQTNTPYQGINSGFSGGGMTGAPDVGTLGGTMSDHNGENSSTMPGHLGYQQSQSNSDVNQNPFGYDFNQAGFQNPNEWNLNKLFNDSRMGLPDYSQFFGNSTSENGIGSVVDNFPGYGQPNEISNWDHPAVKFARGILGFNPMGAIANLGIDAVRGKNVTGSLLGQVPGAGPMLRTAYNASQSSDPARSLATQGAGTLGSVVGGGIAGPLGALAGGSLMSSVANQPTSATPGINPSSGPNAAQAGSGGGDLMETMGSLYGMYQKNSQARQLADNASNTNAALQGQMSSLAGMYAPDSPYAKQLAQELARKDAKAGRNSQYGTRGVELQARLAALAPTVATSMASLGKTASEANIQAQSANQNRQIAAAQTFDQILGTLGKNQGIRELASTGVNKLQDLWSNWNAPSQQSSTIEYT